LGTQNTADLLIQLASQGPADRLHRMADLVTNQLGFPLDLLDLPFDPLGNTALSSTGL
jgi:hypothetical protein